MCLKYNGLYLTEKKNCGLELSKSFEEKEFFDKRIRNGKL